MDTIKNTQDERDIKTRSSIMLTFEKGDEISVSLIQRRCKTGYFTASRVLENLKVDGLIKDLPNAYNCYEMLQLFFMYIVN